MGILKVIIVFLLLTGCSALKEGENRKITAWGIWAVVMGAPIGVGYWHSERGPDVKSEESSKPEDVIRHIVPQPGVTLPGLTTKN